MTPKNGCPRSSPCRQADPDSSPASDSRGSACLPCPLLSRGCKRAHLGSAPRRRARPAHETRRRVRTPSAWELKHIRLASRERPHLQFCLLQPEPHVHLAVHRRRHGEVLLSLLALAGAPVELAETEVALRDERPHAARFGERQ